MEQYDFEITRNTNFFAMLKYLLRHQSPQLPRPIPTRLNPWAMASIGMSSPKSSSRPLLRSQSLSLTIRSSFEGPQAPVVNIGSSLAIRLSMATGKADQEEAHRFPSTVHWMRVPAVPACQRS